MAISGGVVGLREEARWHQLAQSVRARGCGVVCVYCVCGNAETGNAPPRHGAGALATGSLKICASVFLCRPALPMLELGVLGERTPERTPLEYSGQKRRNSNKVHEQWSLSLSLSLSLNGCEAAPCACREEEEVEEEEEGLFRSSGVPPGARPLHGRRPPKKKGCGRSFSREKAKVVE